MNRDEFLKEHAHSSCGQWERSFISAARDGHLTPWGWSEIELRDGDDTAIVAVADDVLSVGPLGEHLRMPLTPGAAQAVCDLFGWLMPTPWLVYQTWRNAMRVTPTPMRPYKGANLAQYAAHSVLIDMQIGDAQGLVSGHKKDIVVSNIYQPKKVAIFGWYKPEPEVYSNSLVMGDPNRQPIQPLSIVHVDSHVDYSHGIRPVQGACRVNGKVTATEELYRHPTLSRLVSREGPLRTPRYPALKV